MVPLNSLDSFVMRRSKSASPGRVLPRVAWASRSNRSPKTRLVASSSMALSRLKSISPRPGMTLPTHHCRRASIWNPNQRVRPRSSGDEIRRKPVCSGRSFGLVIRPTSHIWSRFRSAASAPDRGRRPAAGHVISTDWTNPATLNRCWTSTASKSASLLGITRPSGFAGQSRVPGTSIYRSPSTATNRGCLIRPSKRCFASQHIGSKPSLGERLASCDLTEHSGDRSASRFRSTTSATTRC
ncbi:hypothetical protein V7x_36840 [Crateriforma conspicua]|uniref:Uncharacterized protein n=1 Tax=Crateriforma conspicua TaxID=2527996 RepID=A0A5C6FNP3_9PLAN|nr:hypothetical protein V7x_36840 [Crateriforma conspicua]